MHKLCDYTIISDVDGTLINYDGTIPQRNLDALHRFVEAGGRFGIATGRSRGLMRDVAKELPVNAPCVLYNGGALYDMEKDAFLFELFLPEQAPGYVAEIAEAFSGIGVMAIKDDTYYHIKRELAFANYFESRDASHFHPGTLESVPQPWYKVLYQVRTEDYDAFFAFVEKGNFPGVRFVATNATLIEMLPAESNKGFALSKLVEMGLVRQDRLAAIGDYFNDLEMIEMAGIGVTLEDAPEKLRASADLVVGPCAGGAVADLVEYLEGLCG